LTPDIASPRCPRLAWEKLKLIPGRSFSSCASMSVIRAVLSTPLGHCFARLQSHKELAVEVAGRIRYRHPVDRVDSQPWSLRNSCRTRRELCWRGCWRNLYEMDMGMVARTHRFPSSRCGMNSPPRCGNCSAVRANATNGKKCSDFGAAHGALQQPRVGAAKPAHNEGLAVLFAS